MADEINVEETTEQDSPTVEENQEESLETEPGENQEQTPDEEEESPSETEDKNWRQVRERLKELETENKRLKGTEQSPFETAKKSEVVTPFLTQQDLNALQFDEFKAQQSIPELDPTSENYNKLFDNAVAGQYTAELNAYARGLVSGGARPLPSATQIAKELKKEWDSLLKSSGAKVKSETLKKAQENLAKKEATVEAEGRSDKRQPSRNQLDNLKNRSRHGDADAIAERLKLSGL
jgi:hypothetical protein